MKDRLGEMMWEKLFHEFAMTTRGGRMREEEAIVQWNQWVADAKNKKKGTYFDHKGPEGAVRIWVHTSDTMKFTSEYMHSKDLVCEGAPIKKPDEDTLQRLRSDVLKDHSTVAGFEGNDFDDVAMGMCLNSESAFLKTDGFMMDICDLNVDGEQEDDDGAGDNVAGPADSAGSGGSNANNGTDSCEPSPQKAKKGPWLERGRVVGSSMRVVKQALQLFEVKANALFTQTRGALQEVQT